MLGIIMTVLIVNNGFHKLEAKHFKGDLLLTNNMIQLKVS